VNQPILGFSLPAIPAGEQVVGAEFSFTMDDPALSGAADIDFDVVISLMGGTSFSGSDFVETPGPSGLGAGNVYVGSLAKDDAGNGDVETFSLTGDALSQLAGLYDLSGAPSQADVFFRLSTSTAIDTIGVNNGSRFNLARDGDPSLVTRSLTLETAPIPEPSTLAQLAIAGVALAVRTGRRIKRTA
jgi:hypothetical protein